MAPEIRAAVLQNEANSGGRPDRTKRTQFPSVAIRPQKKKQSHGDACIVAPFDARHKPPTSAAIDYRAIPPFPPRQLPEYREGWNDSSKQGVIRLLGFCGFSTSV
jgi:hypothetical protein